MPTWVIVAAIVVLLWLGLRAREIFVVSVRGGRALVVRGRVPMLFLTELQSIVEHPPVGRATVRAVRGDVGARLQMSGDIDEGRQQRLRNVFALFPVSRLRAAPPVRNPTVGQWLGIAWLAWLLDRRGR